MEANVLARLATAEIAAKLDLDPGAVEMFEKLFFDVRGSLGAELWIVFQAIRCVPDVHDTIRDNGTLYRVIGYGYGPQILDCAVAVTTGIGREKFSEEPLKCTEALVASLRLKTVTPRQKMQVIRVLTAMMTPKKRGGKRPYVGKGAAARLYWLYKRGLEGK